MNLGYHVSVPKAYHTCRWAGAFNSQVETLGTIDPKPTDPAPTLPAPLFPFYPFPLQEHLTCLPVPACLHTCLHRCLPTYTWVVECHCPGEPAYTGGMEHFTYNSVP